MRNNTVLIILVFFLFTAVGIAATVICLPPLRTARARSREQKVQILDDWFTRIHAAGKFQGVVLICKEGKVIFSKCCGDDGADSPRPLTEHSSFNLASVSKHMTAYCILVLEHRGKLHADDALAKYIPEMSRYAEVTISHLLHHSSGLPDYMALARKSGFSKDVFTTEDMLRLFTLESPEQDFPAGNRFRYSNTGYVLLAEIVSRVSGQSFEAFCQTELFEPLGMQNTRVFNLLSPTGFADRVYGFKRSMLRRRRKRVDLNRFDGVAGDGAVYSSAQDLRVWHQALVTHRLLPEETGNKAYNSGILNNGALSHNGYGWCIGPDGGIEHSGGWQGFTSYLHHNSRNKGLIVLLDNSSNTLRVNGFGFRLNSIGVNLRYFLAGY